MDALGTAQSVIIIMRMVEIANKPCILRNMLNQWGLNQERDAQTVL